MTGMQSQTTAQGYERPNQMRGTHDVPTISNFPDNQTADGGATGVPRTISDPFYPIV